MKIGRTIPPAAAALGWRDLWHGVTGACAPARTVRAREREIRRAFGVPHVFLVSSGSAALMLALRALTSLSSRTKVVVPAYTCFSVPAAVLLAGLRPSLCDISAATFDFDHALLPQALDDDTLCVVAHHLFGVASDVERTRRVCRDRGIFVVEDAAQAMGVDVNGRKLGTIGDIGIFSLGRGKNITCGSGGVIVTRDHRIAAAIARHYRQLPRCSAIATANDFIRTALMTVFIRPPLYWIPAALPFLRLGETIFPSRIPVRRLSGMNAGLLRGWRRRLVRSNRIRSETARDFSRRMGLPLPHGSPYPYLRLPMLAHTPDEKRRLYSGSQARGLGLSAAYPAPVSEIPQLRSSIGGRQFPCARTVAARLLTLPTHHWVSERDRTAIAELCRHARIA